MTDASSGTPMTTTATGDGGRTGQSGPAGGGDGGVAAKAADVKDQAVSAASDLKGTAVEEAASVKDEALSKAVEVKGEAVDHARALLVEARDHVGTQAEDTTKQLAERLRAAAEELRQLARNSEQPDGPMTQLVGQLGQQASRFSERLQSGGYRGLTGDVSRYARRSPGSFLLAAAGAGFAVGRLLRNSDTHALADAAKGDQGSGSGSGSSNGSQGELSSPAIGLTTPPLAQTTAEMGRPDIDLSETAQSDVLPGEIVQPPPPERGGQSVTGVVR